MSANQPIPVILDTDIGDDIDDTWALAMLLRCPELDLKLVTTDMGRAQYRAKLCARLLETAGRTDVPVGLGCEVSTLKGVGDQQRWVESYRLDLYRGRIIEDGAGAMIETILSSSVPVTVIAIGPLPTVAEALKREPRIVRNAHLVGMHGSIYRGYGGREQVDKEYNVAVHVSSCRETFNAPWLSKVVTPLDTCGRISLEGERYGRVMNSSDPLMKAVIENYRIWCESRGEKQFSQRSTVLFDTVAIHLACSRQFCKFKTLNVEVTDDGYTREKVGAPEWDVAVDWTDKEGFMDYLVDRLLMPIIKK